MLHARGLLYARRLLHARCGRFHRARRWRRQRFLAVRLLFARERFAPLVFAQLIFLHGEGGRRATGIALPRTLAALAVAVASAIAPAAPALLVTFTRFALGRWRALVLLLRLLTLRLLTLGRLILWLLTLRRLTLLLWLPRRTLLIVAAALAACTTFPALTTLRLPIAALFQPWLLLAVAVLFVAPAVASAIAPLIVPVVPALLVAPWVALLRLDWSWCHGD